MTVFVAVLFAALLHASWNAIIKTGADKVQGMLVLTLSHAAVGGVLAMFVPLPPVAAWGWLAGSVLIHAAYQSFLAFAYSHGNLSRVYPISRGSAPIFVLLYGFFFLPDVIRSAEYLGITLLGTGIIVMARGVFTSGESRRLLPFAFGAALATAGYTVTDGVGARVAGDATSYIAWLFLLSAPVFVPVCLILRGPSVLRISPAIWRSGAIGGVLSVVAYWIAVWGMTQAPIALVAALRETSVLFAVLIGILFFGEKGDFGKLLAALLIVSGIIITRL